VTFVGTAAASAEIPPQQNTLPIEDLQDLTAAHGLAFGFEQLARLGRQLGLQLLLADRRLPGCHRPQLAAGGLASGGITGGISDVCDGTSIPWMHMSLSTVNVTEQSRMEVLRQ